MIRIDLSQGEEELPLSTNGSDEGDPRMYLLGVDAIHDSSLSPAPPSIVLEIDPSLINIYYSLSIFKKLKHLNTKLLSCQDMIL